MSKVVRQTIRYSISFRQMVVRDVESGLAINWVRRKYGISGGATIQRWIRTFGKDHLLNKIVRVETMEEKDRIKELERQLKEAKVALADSLLAQRCLETLIEEANREYQTDLKKNFGSVVSAKTQRK
jgi:transposase